MFKYLQIKQILDIASDNLNFVRLENVILKFYYNFNT